MTEGMLQPFLDCAFAEDIVLQSWTTEEANLTFAARKTKDF